MITAFLNLCLQPNYYLTDVYDDIPCSLNYTGQYEGWVNSSFIDADKIEFVKKHKLQLDCLFKIEVEVGWQVKIYNKNLI